MPSKKLANVNLRTILPSPNLPALLQPSPSFPCGTRKYWVSLPRRNGRIYTKNGVLYPKLNQHLYSAILQCVRDEPRALVQDMDYFWGGGVRLIRSLKSTYQGNLTLLEKLKLQGELLNPNIHLRSKDESVDSYAARTLRMHRELLSNNIKIQPDILKACFICGLGPEFTDIIRQLNNHNLPIE